MSKYNTQVEFSQTFIQSGSNITTEHCRKNLPLYTHGEKFGNRDEQV